MKSINIFSAGKICKINTDISDLEKTLFSKNANFFVQKKIPDGKIGSFYNKNPDVEINIYNSVNQKIVETYPSFNIYGNNIDYKDILSLSDYLLERSRQSEGIYNLHSSVVGKDESCVIIHGSSKSGKTVLSIESSYNQKLDFLVNERSLINLKENKMVGGCTLLDINQYHRDLFPFLEGKTELKLKKTKNKYDIKSIIYPSIDSGLDKPFIEKKDIVGTEWLLYPEFTSRIKGVNKRLFNFSYPLDSIDTKELAIKRMSDLKDFVNKTPFYFIRGKKEDISKFIKSQL